MEKSEHSIVGIKGLDSVIGLLKNMPYELREGAIRSAFGTSLRKTIKPALMSATPYDTITAGRKGKVRTISKKNFIVVTHGKKLKGIEYNPTQMVIGYSQAVYPMRWIEYGTVRRKTQTYAGRPFKEKTAKDGDKNIQDLTPNPFVRQTYQTAIPKLLEFVEKELGNVIDKLVKKRLK